MNLSTFDLNLIRSLDALLQEQSVTRAAAKLCLTQQAMSGSLKRLREHFDDPLLVRVGRGLELTPLAAALRDPVREIMLQMLAMLRTQPSFDPGRADRTFRLAMSDYAMLALLPNLMPRLTTEAPGIKLDVRLLDARVYHSLADGELDLCVLPGNSQLYHAGADAGLRSLVLYQDDFVCVVDPDRGPSQDSLTRDDYLAMSHTTLKLGGSVKSLVTAAWEMLGIAPKVSASANNFISQLLMVSGTPLVTTTQRRLALAVASMLPLRIMECPIPIEPLVAKLRWHERTEADPAHRYMREAIRDASIAFATPSSPPAQRP